jgi:short-subunit dehydrogenase
MPRSSRPLAIITGASTGIGYELAKCCAQDGYDLVVVADELEIKRAAEDFGALGADVDALQADLASLEGVDKLYETIGGRPVEALLANAGRGLGKGFLDQDFDDVLRVVNTNIYRDDLVEMRTCGEAHCANAADHRACIDAVAFLNSKRGEVR